MVVNRRVVFNQVRPTGLPEPGVVSRPDQTEIDLDSIPLNGGVLVRNVAASLDPTMRNRMKGDTSYFSPPYVKDEPIQCIGISQVLRSELDAYAPGDLLFLWSMRLEEYSVLPAQLLQQAARKMPVPTNGLSITTYLGAAGMAGMTAYMGIKEIFGDLKAGNKLFVTGAAGAVGQLVVQIARQAGVHVIASAGSDEKCRFLKDDLGCEAVFNYKTSDPFTELKKFGGETGIHYYFDNVGGTQLEAYIENAARYGIIAACGYISGYNADKPEDIVYPRNLFKIVSREIKYQGFLVSSFLAKWMDQFLTEVPQWIAEGKIKVKEDVTFGVWGAEDAFLRLFTGDNEGKVAVLIDVDHADKWNLAERKAKSKVWQ